MRNALRSGYARRGSLGRVVAGVVFWYVLNGLLFLPALGWNAPGKYGGFYTPLMMLVLILPINALALLIAVLKARPMAAGIVLAIAMNFAISLLLSLTLNAECFIPFFIQ